MMKKKKTKKTEEIKEIYKHVNTRSVEIQFKPTGIVKSIGQRTPVYELIKELEEEDGDNSI